MILMVHMSKYPVLNGLEALSYIILIASVMFWGIKMIPREDSFLAPQTVIVFACMTALALALLFTGVFV